MNKALIYNLILNLILISLLIVHILILFNIIPSQYFWDNTLKDNKSIIISEILTIVLYLGVILLYSFFIQHFRKRRAQNLIMKLLIVLFVYFFFQLVGALIGTEFIYKLTSSLTYFILCSFIFITYVYTRYFYQFKNLKKSH